MLYNGDCLEIMKHLADNSIDLVLTDPPYGTTACKWDNIIDFDLMWAEIERIRKKECAVILFGSEPFSSMLRMSNLKNFKYDWIWNKGSFGNPMLAKKQTLRIHEIISVFYKNIYTPVGLLEVNKQTKQGTKITENVSDWIRNSSYLQTHTNYPRSIISFSKDKTKLHPTQKPIALMQYLIQTYSKENDIVLDFTMGSGSTGVACKQSGRRFIGIELDKGYFDIAEKRISSAVKGYYEKQNSKESI